MSAFSPFICKKKKRFKYPWWKEIHMSGAYLQYKMNKIYIRSHVFSTRICITCTCQIWKDSCGWNVDCLLKK